MEKFLYESAVDKLAYKNDNIFYVITYDLCNENDKNEVLSLKDELLDMLFQTYVKTLYGIKGANDINQLIENCNIVRIAYYYGVPICVFFYKALLNGTYKINHYDAIKIDYLFDEESYRFGTYCGIKQGEFHDIGKKAFDAIIERDKRNAFDYNWVEASGPLKECFKKHDAYNLPNKYAQEILKENIISCDDGYHYKRAIGQHDEIFEKTIFGINSKDTLDKVAKETFGGFIEDLEYCYTLLRAAQKLKEEKEKEPNTLSGRPGSIQYALNIVQYFDEAIYYSKMTEMPRQLIKYLEYARDALIASGSQEHRVKKDIEICNDMLSIIEPLEIISNAKIRIIQYANVI